MDQKNKPLVIILGSILFLLLIGLVINTIGSGRRLKKAMKKLDEADAKLDKALHEINYSMVKLDSLQQGLSVFRWYVKDVQGRVEIMDLERKLKETRFQVHSDSIRDRLKQLYKEVEMTGGELPEIPVAPLNYQ